MHGGYHSRGGGEGKLLLELTDALLQEIFGYYTRTKKLILQKALSSTQFSHAVFELLLIHGTGKHLQAMGYYKDSVKIRYCSLFT